ncbi:MAG: aminopeptidase [Bacteroidetes bacterium GWA2_31_9]|nr:MAG: aminopeptidase [Bacteroidetes bacterium GWA2_31_9]
MKQLKQLCSIHAPTGEEYYMRDFLIEYINNNKSQWKSQPQLFYGKDFKDSLILVFGKPRTAIFAHMDSVGFNIRYNNELIPIGSPRIINGTPLLGKDSKGEIQCELKVIDSEEETKIFTNFSREIERGTSLTFKSNFIESENHIESCYLDNRLGIKNALEIANSISDGIIAFTCGEEAGGGTVELIAKFIYENYKVSQALISDITWVTEGVKLGDGCVISLRDKMIPSRKFVNKIIKIAKEQNIKFQIEVEDSGSSDGGYLHKTPYPIDWCFIGVACENIHSPSEKVHKEDILNMTNFYKKLIELL